MKNLKFSFLALFVGAIMGGKVVAQVPNYVPTNGLVGWWPFNGNANDESGNGNNGTVNGATLTTDRFGNVSKAYSFDGVSNFINIPFSNSLDITGSLTLSSWLKVDSINPAFYGAIIFHGDNQGGRDSYAMGIYGSSGLLQSGKYVGNGATSSDWRGDNVILNDLVNWAYISTTFDVTNCNLKIYINGILNSDTTFTSSCLINYQTNLNSFFTSFGGLGAFGQQFFNGKIDDIGIWNRALSECEIQDLYNSQLGSFSNANVSITPTSSSIGSNATLKVSSPVSSLQWQSNPGNMGWNNVVDNGNYNGAANDTLVVSNLQLSNHNQPFRVLACGDTSNVVNIQIADTCITNVTDTTLITVTDTNVVTVYDTLLTTVTDTLIINTTLSLPAPNNENTILIYPNPASDHITIDNGNYTAMVGYSIKIENNAGQQVFQSAINQQQFYVDLSTWTGNGLYFFHLIDSQNNTVTVRKIVLQ